MLYQMKHNTALLHRTTEILSLSCRIRSLPLPGICRRFGSPPSVGVVGEGNSAKDIRRKFIDYFSERHDHQFVRSSSVLPPEGAGLLFTNAGMNQFKDVIHGTADSRSHPWRRVVNSQKCIRAGGKHNDLEDVGRDSYHHTFFEMMGNWSFGDYFKPEACAMAWELLTDVYRLPADKLYVTYFEGDEGLGLPPDHETRNVWLSLGIPPNRILPFGMKDNFWEMGREGPCGPSSEIHYNRSDQTEAPHLVNRDNPDMLEVWNLVFMEKFRESNGQLKSLPKRHVDTGLGLERLVAILQGQRSNYDTDLFQPLMEAIHLHSGARPYSGLFGPSDVDLLDTAYRVVADHVRMLSIAIADGCLPDYYKRGYVLKRVIRRAVRFASEKLHSPPGLLSSLVPVVVESLGDTYPELRVSSKNVCTVIDREERQFLKTLKKGQKFLLKSFEKLGPERILPGEAAWKMYDGFGYPIDLTTLIANEHGVTVDMEGYEKTRQKTHEVTSRGGMKNKQQMSKFSLESEDMTLLREQGVPPTDDSHKYSHFDEEAGRYEFPILSARIVALKSEDDGMLHEVSPGAKCAVILDRTNFYAEQGGQISDEGSLINSNTKETLFAISNVQSSSGYALHVGEVEKPLRVGMQVELKLDEERRLSIMKNHTATHILNFALREILPDSEQRGSLVASEKLRFDFNSERPLTREELGALTEKCNNLIREDHRVCQRSLPLSAARAIPGVRATFMDESCDPALVVSVGQNGEDEGTSVDMDGRSGSVEFCGGTHVHHTGHIGRLVIVSQKLSSGGVRRLTAITGHAAKAAIRNGEVLRAEVDLCSRKVHECLDSTDSPCGSEQVASLQKWVVSLLGDLKEINLDISQKEDFKTKVDSLREKLKKHEKRRKKNVINQILSDLEEESALSYPSKIVKILPEDVEPWDLKGIETQCQKRQLKSPVMLITRRSDKIHCLCISTMGDQSEGASALKWAQRTAKFLGGTVDGDDLVAKVTGKAVNYEEDLVNKLQKIDTS